MRESEKPYCGVGRLNFIVLQFDQTRLMDAYAHARSGGQALYLRKRYDGEPDAAWLIDHDLRRLDAAARRFGLRRPRVLRGGRSGQCVELRGVQLARALAECSQTEMQL